MPTRFETFSFLPPMTTTQVTTHIEHMMAAEYHITIEFAENPSYEDLYWKNWPLPVGPKPTPQWFASQINTCGRANPYAYIRLCAYDPTSQRTVRSFIVKTPMEGVQ